jgi:hypothetical protein
VQQLLHKALQDAAKQADAGAAGASAAAAALPTSTDAVRDNSTQQQQQQQQRGWRLASFSSDLPGAPDLLPLLPCHSLTQLSLSFKSILYRLAAPTSALVQLSELTRFTSLQCLTLDSSHGYCWLPDGCLPGLAQLSQLTSLTLLGDFMPPVKGMGKQLQQLLAHALPLQRLRIEVVDVYDNILDLLPLPNLTHLTRLEEIIIDNVIADGVALPTQLCSLRLGPDYSASNIARLVLPLQHLQHLHLSPMSMEPWQLLELARLPKLKSLALHCCVVHEACHVSATWRLLPQLNEISMEFFKGAIWHPVDDVEQCMQVLLADAGAAKQLTRLHVDFTAFYVPYRPIAVCAGLAQLASLRGLTLFEVRLMPGDALALSALTGLTQLEILDVHNCIQWYTLSSLGLGPAWDSNLRQAVCTRSGTALVRSLSQLCSLRIQGCSYHTGDKEFVAAVGQLHQLTELHLDGHGLTRHDLMHLTGLSSLQQFRAYGSAEVNDMVINKFLAAVSNEPVVMSNGVGWVCPCGSIHQTRECTGAVVQLGAASD